MQPSMVEMIHCKYVAKVTYHKSKKSIKSITHTNMHTKIVHYELLKLLVDTVMV